MKNILEFLEYRCLSNVEVSEDGEKIAFAVYDASLEKNKYLSNVWIYYIKENTYKQITCNDAIEEFYWIDNEHIGYCGVEDEELNKKIENGEEWTCFYKLNINTGISKEYLRVPVFANKIKRLDSDKYVINALRDNNYHCLFELTDEEKNEVLKEKNENKDYHVAEEIPFWRNGASFTNRLRNVLYIYDQRKKEFQLISDAYSEINDFTIKDRKILYIDRYFEDNCQENCNMKLYDIDSDKTEYLLPKDTYTINFADFIGKDIYFFGFENSKPNYMRNSNFYKVLDNKNTELISENDCDFPGMVSTDIEYGGGALYRTLKDGFLFPTVENQDVFINKFTIDGKITKLNKSGSRIDSFALLNNDLYFTGLKGNRLPELYKCNSSREVRITSLNEEWYENKKPSELEPLKIVKDGVEIEGYVIKPINYDPSKNYPAVLEIHGGPRGAFGSVYFFENRLLSENDYFVFFCNPRGSAGRGDDFANIRGRYGVEDYDDLMKFTDAVLEKYPQIDANRLGVTGGSYGGYMTNWIITQTNRFACAIAQDSISSWITLFLTSDGSHSSLPGEMLGTPWDNYENLWKQSPLKYADKVKTPTLFMQCTEDYRCWYVEALQMYTALKFHNIESRLFLFDGENHDLVSTGAPKHKVKRVTEIVSWFDKYLK